MSTLNKTVRLSTQATEIAVAAPQVIAMRTARLLMAGVNPNAKDQHEFFQMGAEKVEAFGEAWFAMTTQMLRVNQEFMMMWVNAWNPYRIGGLMSRPTRRLETETLKVLSKGITPVHKRVVSNAKRLSRG
ncbi:polyhydroxyalkanoate granule-associated phasin [Thiofilum flexile]|uniref:polyhydroxyalkanoate granule-associated phasin n=1 Tax=Thiofilum flexile TaxID=125627 RepID=UPI000368700B|nr:polyhydroxyalkanoate granule-associated phasin [Thiofilum flexile]